MTRIIETNNFYTISEESFDDGMTITLRRWHSQPEGADILFDDTFARACGYSSKDDMIASTIGEQGKKEIIAKWGYLPKWVRWYDNGKIYFVGETIRTIGVA